MSNPEIASLAREIALMQRQLRDLAIGNPLNNAEVVDASGKSVRIGALAFGSVTGADLTLVQINAAANSGPGGQGWFAWGPNAWVYVTGGKLRIDIACEVAASGNNMGAYMSYRVYGPGTVSGQAGLPTVVWPDYARSVELLHGSGGQLAMAAMGTFGLHENLAAGWYYVEVQYAASWSGSTLAQYANWNHRRLLVTPF